MKTRPLAFLGILLLASCSVSPIEQKRLAFVAALKTADQPILYEGLPHQSYERELFQKELESKKTIVLGDFPFYEKPLSLSETDAKLLTSLLCDRRCLTPSRRPKACGGFHPDFCLEWRRGDLVYHAQICFGCSDVYLIEPEAKSFWELTNDYQEKLVAVLRPYRLNRPPFGPNLLHPW